MTDVAEMPPNEARADAKQSLVDELQSVLKHADGKPIKVDEIIVVLKHRGYAMVMLLLALPFLIPMPPGLSTPLGAALMVYGFTLSLRLNPWLPAFVRNRTLSYALLQKMIDTATRGGRRIEKLLKPRLGFMLWPAVDVTIGLCVLFCGFFLALPLPIPGSNIVPAIPLVLLLLGLIERDGVFVIIGQVLTVLLFALTAYVCFLFWKHGIDVGWEKLKHLFG